MSTRLFSMLAALCGIIGVAMLITSFAINPGPGSHPTLAQFIAFGKQYGTVTLIGSWLQAVGTTLIVLFALALVNLAGLATRFIGQITLFGGTVLTLVSLVEIVFYLSAVYGNPATTGLISLDIISAVQHLYSIIAAPILFLPVASVILISRVLPRLIGYIALVLGTAFAVLGVLALFGPFQNLVIILSVVQGFWWLAAAITLFVRAAMVSTHKDGALVQSLTKSV